MKLKSNSNNCCVAMNMQPLAAGQQEIDLLKNWWGERYNQKSREYER
jgi:tRNA nucleotidyltransferase/poly(A) polymerase